MHDHRIDAVAASSDSTTGDACIAVVASAKAQATRKWRRVPKRPGVYVQHKLLRDRNGESKRCPADDDVAPRRCRCPATYRGQVWSSKLGRAIQSRTFRNADEAAGWVVDMKRGIATTRGPSAAKVPVRVLVERFIQAAEDGSAKTRRRGKGRRYSPRTTYVYRGLAANHIYPRVGDRNAAEMSDVDWQQFTDDLVGDQHLKGQSVRYVLGVVRATYGWATQANVRLVPRNPTLTLDLPEDEARRMPRVVGKDTAAAMLATLDRDDVRVIWALMFYLGLRISEACNVDWPDIDFRRNVVTVTKSKTKAGTGRQVPMPTPLRTLLLDWQRQNHRARLGPVVPGRRALRMGGEPARVAAERCWKGRFPVLRPHDARHTFASWLVAAGEDLASVCEWMGHASIAVTANYVRTLPVDDVAPRTTSRLDAFLDA